MNMYDLSVFGAYVVLSRFLFMLSKEVLLNVNISTRCHNQGVFTHVLAIA